MFIYWTIHLDFIWKLRYLHLSDDIKDFETSTSKWNTSFISNPLWQSGFEIKLVFHLLVLVFITRWSSGVPSQDCPFVWCSYKYFPIFLETSHTILNFFLWTESKISVSNFLFCFVLFWSILILMAHTWEEPVMMWKGKKKRSFYHQYFGFSWHFTFSCAFMITRRYGPLSGPNSSSCGGFRPLAKAFFALRAKRELIMLFGPFWQLLVTSSNLGNFY